MRLWSWFFGLMCYGLLVQAQPASQLMATLDYSTYFGGSRTDIGVAMALAPDGSILVVGHTNSFDLPVPPNAFQSGYAGGPDDVFIFRFSADLSTVLSGTYLGGSGSDQAQDILVTDQGDVIIAIRTTSADMPLGSNPILDTLGQGGILYVARMDTSLSQLEAGSYVGQIFPDPDYGRARLAPATTGSFYVSGSTSDKLFPVGTNGAQQDEAGGVDGFVLQIDNDCSTIQKGTFIGGSDDDFVTAMHRSGSAVWLTGKTHSTDWPVVGSGLIDSLSGSSDMILARLSTDLSSIERSTYFGGKAFDAGATLVEEANGDIVAGGLTYSDTLPTAGHVHKAYLNWALADVFMMRTDADISQLKTVTYYGGASVDYLTSLSLFSNGQLCLAGYTLSADIPIQTTGFDTTFGGPTEGFLARFTESFGGFTETSFYGGTGADQIRQVIVNMQDEIYATGYTAAPDLPLSNAYQDQLKGISDAFIFRTEMPFTGITQANPSQIQAQVQGDRLVVQLTEPSQVSFQIYALDGRLLMSRSSTDHFSGQKTFRLPDLSRGVYLISLKVGEETTGLKWMVIR